MRAIENTEDNQKKRKRNATYIAIFMLLLLVLSTVGYAFFYNSDSSNSSNVQTGSSVINESLEIQQYGDKWAIPFRGQYFYLSNHPNITEKVDVQLDRDLSTFYGADLYLDAKNTSEYSELENSIGKYSAKVLKACYGSCIENIPEKDCSVNMIVVRESKNNKVYQEENCIFVDGDIDSIDALIYKLFNINSQSF